MKILKPSLREKKRYLLIQGKNLKKNVPEVISKFIGILGMSETCLNWIEIKNDKAIIAINRKMLDKVRSSFLLSDKNIKILKVSGSIKKVK